MSAQRSWLNMKHADKLFGVFQRLHRAEDFEGSAEGWQPCSGSSAGTMEEFYWRPVNDAPAIKAFGGNPESETWPAL